MLRAAILLAALVSAPALADVAPAHDEEHDDWVGPFYLSGGYQHQRETAFQLNGEGYDVGIGVDLFESYGIGVSYSNVQTDPIETDAGSGRLEYRTTAVSAGAYLPLADEIGISGGLGYAFSSTQGLDDFQSDPAEDSEGVIGSVGLHLDLMRWVDLSLGRGYSYIGGEREWDASAGLSFHAFRGIWLDTSYWLTDDLRGWTAGLRMRVGN